MPLCQLQPLYLGYFKLSPTCLQPFPWKDGDTSLFFNEHTQIEPREKTEKKADAAAAAVLRADQVSIALG